jgi:hypothetical protein
MTRHPQPGERWTMRNGEVTPEPLKLHERSGMLYVGDRFEFYSVNCWYSTGACSPANDHPCDLISLYIPKPERKPLELWVNQYAHNDVYAYGDKERALKCASSSAVRTAVHMTEATGKEGEAVWIQAPWLRWKTVSDAMKQVPSSGPSSFIRVRIIEEGK